ncbi:HypC/HybG/HupF family hydrogenase formation chaperone [bacterium]|nr:HypC/HybG/HupF family hydrogenase formation chaperone [bacterium]
MCLAVPGKILDIAGVPSDPLGPMATVDFQGSRLEASLAMTPEAQPGDWVLVHAGFALTVLDEAEALRTWDMLREALGEELPLPGAPPAGEV